MTQRRAAGPVDPPVQALVGVGGEAARAAYPAPLLGSRWPTRSGLAQMTSAMTVREKQPWSDAVDRFRFAVGKRRGRLTRMPAAFRLVVRGKIASWCYDFCSA